MSASRVRSRSSAAAAASASARERVTRGASSTPRGGGNSREGHNCSNLRATRSQQALSGSSKASAKASAWNSSGGKGQDGGSALVKLEQELSALNAEVLDLL